MGQPDISMKALLTKKDVFADVINAIVFCGRQQICDKDLKEIPTGYHLHGDNMKLKELFRDIMMEDKKNGVTYLLLGIENQMKIDYTMPLRVMGYDYKAYEKQVAAYMEQNRKNKIFAGAGRILPEQKLKPVITLVLYYGDEAVYYPSQLKEMLELPDEEDLTAVNYIQNYRMNVVCLKQLSDEEIQRFRSDFYCIAKYVKNKYNKEKVYKIFREDSHPITHMKETLSALAAISHDARYLRYYKAEVDDEREEKKMCELIDICLEKGMEKGVEQGEECFAMLTEKLLRESKTEELLRAATDRAFRKELYREYGIKTRTQ